MINIFYIKKISKEQLQIVLDTDDVILEEDFKDGSVNIECRDETAANWVSEKLDNMNLEYQLV